MWPFGALERHGRAPKSGKCTGLVLGRSQLGAILFPGTSRIERKGSGDHVSSLFDMGILILDKGSLPRPIGTVGGH